MGTIFVWSTPSPHCIGSRQRSPFLEILIFSIIAGHHLKINAALLYAFRCAKGLGGKNEIKPVWVYAIKFGQC